jgi:hypothetical protein
MAVLAIELYLAHLRGKSAEEISAALQLPCSVVEERIEAARLCVLYQLPLLVAEV